jgi:gliding motility-associated-like protein
LKKYLSILFTLILFCGLPNFCLGSIQIDSVKTTVSNCPNDGSITVYATTNTPAILYSIISGPVTQPVQTGNFFNSLPAGTYTVKVTNGSSETATQVVSIAGNYIELDFNPITTAPYCPGGNNGQIIGNIIPNTGYPSYTWELISPSPIIRPSQTSDTFNNLIAGNYSVRVTDGCGSFRTIVATVPARPDINLNIIEGLSRITMVGCDSALITVYLETSAYRYPYTCTFESTQGTFTTTSVILDTTSFGGGALTISKIIPGFTYGNYVKVTITDACGSTTATPFWRAQPFEFCRIIQTDFTGCDYFSQIIFDLNASECYSFGEINTGATAPLIYQITDASTNLEVDSDTVYGYQVFNNGYNFVSGFQGQPLATNKTYTLTVKDSCGKVFTNTFFLPDPTLLPPKYTGAQITPDACVDSAAFAVLNLVNFRTNPKIIFLSGPTVMGSTKPGYEYTNSYVYPDTATIFSHFFGINYDIFFVSGLSVGTYYFKVIDSCGAEVFDSLVIKPSDVTDFKHRFWYKKGCLGENEIHYSVNNPSGYIKITNLSNGAFWEKFYSSQDFTQFINDSILNLPSGTYAINFTYSGYLSAATASGKALNYSPITCQAITDTIIIEGYQTPTITGSNSILCNNSINIQLIPDSTKGVPPYQYEIIAGPQTFPVQNSNVFILNAAGTYTARIYDVCGNASTASITADTITFPPLIPQQGTCNSIELFYNSTDYFTYTWTGPNSQVYTGDTLFINPITAADTGTYQIERIVNINGCTDTAYSSYNLTFPVTYRQVKTICNGDSVHIGDSAYGATGIFSNRLLSSKGCDSIVVLDLTVVQYKRDSTTIVICQGQSVTSAGNIYTQTGIYRNTIATATCDSIVILNLRVAPEKKDSTMKIICQGQSVTSGGNIYTQTGIYRDTISTATCDSIVIINLRVDPEKKDSITKVICEGETVISGGNVYNQTGIYRNTIATATCDSIVTLNLTVNPAPVINITANPLTVDSGAVVQLNTTAAASYLWSSVATLNNNAIQNPEAIITQSSWIYLLATASPGNCTALDSIFIVMRINPCNGSNSYIYMPNAFTPNNDRYNNVFKIYSNNVTLNRFEIFNRWGEVVFETKDINKGWNGMYKGRMLAGNYVYFISYNQCNLKVPKTIKGNIMLLK